MQKLKTIHTMVAEIFQSTPTVERQPNVHFYGHSISMAENMMQLCSNTQFICCRSHQHSLLQIFILSVCFKCGPGGSHYIRPRLQLGADCCMVKIFLQGFERVTLQLKKQVNANEPQQHPEAFQLSRCMRNTAGVQESELHIDKP